MTKVSVEVKAGRGGKVTTKIRPLRQQCQAPVKIGRIAFSMSLAGKVHDRSKRMTRRVIFPTPEQIPNTELPVDEFTALLQSKVAKGLKRLGHDNWCFPESPYAVGQILAVVEPWRVNRAHDLRKPSELWGDMGVDYPSSGSKEGDWGKLRPSRFMPRIFVRTFIRVTEIRWERLMSIEHRDCCAEGLELVTNPNGRKGYADEYIWNVGGNLIDGSINAFAALWDGINKEKGQPKFADDPWVWVVGFERVEMANPWNVSKPVVALERSFPVDFKRGAFTHPGTGIEYKCSVSNPPTVDGWVWKVESDGGKPLESAPLQSESDAINDLNRFLRLSILYPQNLQQ